MWKWLVLLTIFIGSIRCEHNLTNKLNNKQKEKPTCPDLKLSNAQIDTVEVFPTMDFMPEWIPSGQFWDVSFEARYMSRHNDTAPRNKLEVFVVPHSHNDAGWLRTFEEYFEEKTSFILDNIVTKLHQHPNMTFVWNEISFLSAWWDAAEPNKREKVKQLVHSGRLEITTGGWVMPDEACTHIYALLDQLIVGHQWTKRHLEVSPKTGWSIDPFGHGPTVPYLLDQSGLHGSIIQRIHYAWKQWLAQRQIEEFYWIPGWKTKKPSMIMHNQPFDIYSVKSSCGPHMDVCLNYDFGYIGEYAEYPPEQHKITDQNVHSKSKTLIEEYERIGSLTEHNVVLVPLGDDFRYEFAVEFDAQYTNYMKMFNYINAHPEQFRAHVRFGTPLDYFNEVKKRQKNIPTLKGDFFVYSDIFNQGKPAYWSGYFTTRPYVKILARKLEHHLRTAEILYTFAQQSEKSKMKFKKGSKPIYGMLTDARRILGLIQHHDGITGTSTELVMSDFVSRLTTAVHKCTGVQEAALRALLLPPDASASALHLVYQWDTYNTPLDQLQIFFAKRNKIVLFNPLTETRTDVITVRVASSAIRIFDDEINRDILYQISPILEYQGKQLQNICSDAFDLIFVATVPALSTHTYTIQKQKLATKTSVVYCNNCKQLNGNVFETKKLPSGDICIENTMLKLVVNSSTGFLRQFFRKDVIKKHYFRIRFGAYWSQQESSGLYLFKPDEKFPEKNILYEYFNGKSQQNHNIVMVSGPVYTEVTTMYLPFLVHTVRIFHVEHPVLARAVLVENEVDFESPPKNRETELYMRVQTDIQNGDLPEFYTDQNGFQYQKRIKVEKLGIEGNYYPITTMAWLQDRDTRLTLVTNHAQGAAAFKPGHLELMLDRRTEYDDHRGVGEGLTDNKRVILFNWILLEAMPKNTERDRYQVPSQAADYLSRTLNYPLTMYLVNTTELGGEILKSIQLVKEFPAGIHLVTLRTESTHSSGRSPGRSALLVLQRPGGTCAVGHAARKPVAFTVNTTFVGPIKKITAVSLTGLKTLRVSLNLTDIKMKPMELKTYRLLF